MEAFEHIEFDVDSKRLLVGLHVNKGSWFATLAIHKGEKNWEDVEIPLPSKNEVCGTCQGYGSHDHRGIIDGALTEDQVRDPDFMEDYQNGNYSVPCEECRGANVVLVVDEYVLDHDDPPLMKAIRDAQESVANYNRASAREREMGY